MNDRPNVSFTTRSDVPSRSRPRQGRKSRPIGLILILPVVLLILAGCATMGIQSPREEMTNVDQVYRAPDFYRSDLAREGAAVLRAEVHFGLEGYRDLIERRLYESLIEEWPGDTGPVQSPNEAVRIISQTGLTQEYARMMRLYRETGALSKDTLRALHGAGLSRFLALPVLMDMKEESSGRLSAGPLRISKTRSTTLRMRVEIWDAKRGTVAWEGMVELTLAQEVIQEEPISIAKIVGIAWANLIRRIPERPGSDGVDGPSSNVAVELDTPAEPDGSRTSND